MKRFDVGDADDDRFEVLGLAPTEAPGLAAPVGLLIAGSADCRQPVTVTLLARSELTVVVVPGDCAALQPLHANVRAATVMPMCRVFIRLSPSFGGNRTALQIVRLCAARR